ncbi:coiled-coil domain-containing protein [Helicobacter pylori]
MGSFFSLGKSSNDIQENPKDALKFKNFHEKYTEPTETTDLTEKNQKLTAEKENLNNQLNASQKQVKDLQDSKQVLENEKADLTNENTKLKNEKTELTNKITGLSTDKENLNNQLNASQKQVKALQDSKQVLENEKTELSKDKENLTKEKAELEQKHAPYEKLEKLYEVFLEVKDRLNFNFVATTHSAMDLIASVLSDSKYYVESLYNKASQELSDKRSDKGEKLAELFDLLFEYIKDSKFERLKEPSAYDHSCKTLYPEQNASQKMQRVVLRGYTYDKKIACHTIVDMGS